MVDPLDEAVSRWSSEARQAEAAQRRRQSRLHRDLAGAEARFSGVLLDLHERGSRIVVTTDAGRHHRGRLGVVASDFVTIDNDERLTLIGTAHISRIASPGPAHSNSLPSERQAHGGNLASALSVIAEDRPLLSYVVASGGEARLGIPVTVGEDVVVFDSDTQPASIDFVPIAKLVELHAC